MTTLHQDIRAGLQKRALTTTGMPAEGSRAYEGVKFEPQPGEAWVRMTLIPTDSMAIVSGASATQTGLFQIDLYEPSGLGTGSVEALADAVMDKFRVGTLVYQNSEVIKIVGCRRVGAVMHEADFERVIVQVSYSVHSTRL